MSITALIVVENKKDKFNLTLVLNNGYIKNGVGQMLEENWTNPTEIKKLCKNKYQVLHLEKNLEETKFTEEQINEQYLKRIRDVSEDQWKTEARNYSKTYLWISYTKSEKEENDNKNGYWAFYNIEDRTLTPVKNYF